MSSLSLRLGNTLYSRLKIYYQSFSERMTKSKTTQYLLIKYLERPQIYSVLEVRELREPMDNTVTLAVPEKLQKQLSEFAAENNLKISEVIRMAIYQELMMHGK